MTEFDVIVSPNGVYKTLLRLGLDTRAKRLALVAGYRAPFAPPRDPEPEPHIETTRPGELVVERLQRTILEECWRPAFARYLQVRLTGLRRDLAQYLHDYTTNANTTDASPRDDTRPT